MLGPYFTLKFINHFKVFQQMAPQVSGERPVQRLFMMNTARRKLNFDVLVSFLYFFVSG